MTRRILFVQGGGEGVHDGWDNRLVADPRRALGDGYEIDYPRLPNEGDPSLAAWKTALGEAFAPLGDDALLVGHSIGATILLHTLAEQAPDRPPAGLFLIAPPFIGDGGWPSDEIAPKPDLGALLPAATAIFLYQGDADDTVPVAHAGHYARAIPQAVIRRLRGRDHQLNDDMSEVAADVLRLAARPAD